METPKRSTRSQTQQHRQTHHDHAGFVPGRKVSLPSESRSESDPPHSCSAGLPQHVEGSWDIGTPSSHPGQTLTAGPSHGLESQARPCGLGWAGRDGRRGARSSKPQGAPQATRVRNPAPHPSPRASVNGSCRAPLKVPIPQHGPHSQS